MSTLDYPVAPMPAEDTAKHVSRLTLKSQLDDMALLWGWVEALIAQFAIPSDTAFAVHLCLEEAISNVIRHGYIGQGDQMLTVNCALPEVHLLEFTIEDQAPPFDPLEPEHIEELVRASAGGFSSARRPRHPSSAQVCRVLEVRTDRKRAPRRQSLDHRLSPSSMTVSPHPFVTPSFPAFSILRPLF